MTNINEQNLIDTHFILKWSVRRLRSHDGGKLTKQWMAK